VNSSNPHGNLAERSRTPATRDAFLARVRAAQPAAQALPPTADFPAESLDAAQRLAQFRAALEGMGGRCIETEAGLTRAALVQQIRALHGADLPICSASPEVLGERSLDATVEPASLHDVEVAVVRARYGVAETGSVWFSEAEYQVNAIGYLAQHLVVLLDPAAIVPGIQDVYRLPDFAEARYAVLVTGPSATADIEGILIRGAQGVRSLTVLLTPFIA